MILAHPRRDSLCGALFDACADGARQAGVECRELILSEIRFDPDVHEVSPEQQPLEPDLVRAQRDIHWAEHLVFVYPTWWGPPLKFSHRGFGEFNVALTHSADTILAGYVAQGGGWTDSSPWLLALPLGVALHRRRSPQPR